MRDVEEFFEGFQVAAQNQVQDRQAVQYLGRMSVALEKIEARLASLEAALRDMKAETNTGEGAIKIESPPALKEDTMREESMLSFEV